MAETVHWGLLGRMIAQPGKRGELVAALKAAYDACLAMPQVGDWSVKLAPLLAGIEHRTGTVPLGNGR